MRYTADGRLPLEEEWQDALLHPIPEICLGDDVVEAEVTIRESDIDFDCISVPGVWFYYEMDISYREPRLEGLYLSNSGATVDLFRSDFATCLDCLPYKPMLHQSTWPQEKHAIQKKRLEEFMCPL